MVQVTYVSFDGTQQTVDVKPGYSAMEGAVKNAIKGIDADCGGNCYCATCRVFIPTDWKGKLGEQNDYEQQLLDSLGGTEPNVRLSCQIKITDDLAGLVLHIPETQK